MSFPLTAIEKQAKTHAILCTTGFLILLPVGVLVARFTRTFTNRYAKFDVPRCVYFLLIWLPSRWWAAHFIIQFLISGPVIFAGWYMGHKTADQLQTGHFFDPHQKTGLALLILYVAQLLLGIVIHYFKFPSLFRGRRPPQNFLHVFLGLVIFILAAFQVRAVCVSMRSVAN